LEMIISEVMYNVRNFKNVGYNRVIGAHAAA
jgi:hypothetical protein